MHTEPRPIRDVVVPCRGPQNLHLFREFGLGQGCDDTAGAASIHVQLYLIADAQDSFNPLFFHKAALSSRWLDQKVWAKTFH